VLLVSSTPLVLVVHPSVPAKSVKDLVALAKANPGKLNYASTSSGHDQPPGRGAVQDHDRHPDRSHSLQGLGAGGCRADAGEIDMLFSPMPPTVRCEGGQNPGARRHDAQAFAGDAGRPTMNDTLKGFESDNWYGMFFPAGTPREIINRFHAEMSKVLKDADVRALMAKEGAEPLAARRGVRRLLQERSREYAKVIKRPARRWTDG